MALIPSMRGSSSKSVEQMIKSYFEFGGKSVACVLSFSGLALTGYAHLLSRRVDFPEPKNENIDSGICSCEQRLCRSERVSYSRHYVRRSAPPETGD